MRDTWRPPGAIGEPHGAATLTFPIRLDEPPPWVQSRAMGARHVVWPVAVAAILLGFVLLDEHPPTAIVNRAVGGSFIVCGLIVWQRRPDTRTGVLMTVTGFLNLGAQLLGESGSPLLHTLG